MRYKTNLADVLSRLGYTEARHYRALAVKVGVNVRSLYYWMRGEAKPVQNDNFKVLMEELGVGDGDIYFVKQHNE